MVKAPNLMVSTLSFEVAPRHEAVADAARLLYAAPAVPLKVRRSRRYEISYRGSEAAVKSFVEHVLFDPLAQEIKSGEKSQDALFSLEIGMKRGVLDLEKEAILSHHRRHPAEFEIQELKLLDRIEVLSPEGDSPLNSEQLETAKGQFVRDLVNPAIQFHRFV